jgi:RimJ/RimL family protein N-acetyltransferase
MDPVRLRETREDDLDDLVELWNDGRVMRWVGYPHGLGILKDGALEWLRGIRRDRDRHHFVVIASGIGFCGEAYYRPDAGQARAELDIKLRPEAQGRGVATRALSTLIDLVFDREPLVDAVWTEPWPENEKAQALYARCGLAPAPRPDDLPPGPSYWERRRG